MCIDRHFVEIVDTRYSVEIMKNLITVTAIIFLLFIVSCSGKYNWTPLEKLGIKASDLEGEWVCDSMRREGVYNSGTIFIKSNGSKVYATEKEFSSDNETYFSGLVTENPFTVKRLISSPSSGGLEFRMEAECPIGIYSKDSIRLIISDDYTELFVRK